MPGQRADLADVKGVARLYVDNGFLTLLRIAMRMIACYLYV